jgi:hypothetical protein
MDAERGVQPSDCEKLRLVLPSVVKVLTTNLVHFELLLAPLPWNVTFERGR